MKLYSVIAVLIATFVISSSVMADSAVSISDQKILPKSFIVFDTAGLVPDLSYTITCNITDYMANLNWPANEDTLEINIVYGSSDHRDTWVTLGSKSSFYGVKVHQMMKAGLAIPMQVENFSRRSNDYQHDEIEIENDNDDHILSVESCIAMPSGPKVK